MQESISERKVVICPCGKEMRLIVDRCVDWKQVPVFRAYYKCKCGWQSPVSLDYDKLVARNKALAFATRRPPNRPLTLEQVQAMEPHTAVWVEFSEGTLMERPYTIGEILPESGFPQYGKTVRWWTAWPDEEMRKATGWLNQQP